MKTKTILILLMAWLVACAPSTSSPPAQPTATTATATSAPIVAPSPTPLPPTPTAIPPTATPVPPTATPVPTVTPTTAPAVASSCDHPYFPVKPNVQWQYRITYQTGGLAPTTYTETRTSITPNSFVEHREFPNLKSDNAWNCTSEGLVSTQFGSLTTGTSQFNIETLKTSGATIPPASRWTVGATWNNSYEVKGTMATGSGTSINVQGAIDLASKIVGQESVTVPAGTFNALKVEQTLTLKATGTTGGINVPVNISFKSTAWFAQNVGRIKDVTSGDAGVIATTELISFKQ